MSSGQEQQAAAATLDPARLYPSPAALAADAGLTRAERIGLLRRWEYEARSEEVATGEGMPERESTRLQEIASALASLGDSRAPGPPAPPSRHGSPRTSLREERGAPGPASSPGTALGIPMPRGRTGWLRALTLGYVGLVFLLVVAEASGGALVGVSLAYGAAMVLAVVRGDRDR